MLASTVSSVAQGDLFAARVEIDDRREITLRQAASEALKQVLIRVSGDEAVVVLPGIAEAVDKARDYLSLYSYTEDENGLALIAEFDGVAVKDLLRSAGGTYWRASRPSVLVWLVVDEPSRRRFATPSEDAELLDELQSAFLKRGVALRLPLLDLEDTVILSPQILWQKALPRIRVASQRYGTEHILVGRHVALSDGRLLTDWMYLEADLSLSVQAEGTSFSMVTAAGADLAVDAMVSRYAVKLDEASRLGRLTVAIEGVHSYDDYRQVVALFEAIPLLDGVRVGAITGHQLRLSVRGLASGDALQRLIPSGVGLSVAPIAYNSDLSLIWGVANP